jgi:hypothetical protein
MFTGWAGGRVGRHDRLGNNSNAMASNVGRVAGTVCLPALNQVNSMNEENSGLDRADRSDPHQLVEARTLLSTIALYLGIVSGPAAAVVARLAVELIPELGRHGGFSVFYGSFAATGTFGLVSLLLSDGRRARIRSSVGIAWTCGWCALCGLFLWLICQAATIPRFG